MHRHIRVVGSGFSGAVIARAFAEAGHRVTVFDRRAHVAGNCHTERDDGIMVHRYGPHIFHTNRPEVWDYVRRFGPFEPYVHRVKATTSRGVFSLPVNLLTINQLRGERFSPTEAAAYLRGAAARLDHEPRTFEEQALAFVGEELYDTFFRGYTLKQWGRHPRELPASILQRLPVRFNYDDNYFNHPFQGLPRDGYTALVERILDHAGVEVRLGVTQSQAETEAYDHTFWSGPLDAYFEYRLGRLPYRTINFETIRTTGDFQGCAQMNYCDADVPHTRITEHTHLAPWEQHDHTIASVEYSSECGPDDDPYYPIRLAEERALLSDYVDLGRSTQGVSFVGRLGTYRYLDMDVTIHEAMVASDAAIEALGRGERPPAFFLDPLA